MWALRPYHTVVAERNSFNSSEKSAESSSSPLIETVIKLLHSTPLERGTFRPSEITAESLYLNLTFNKTEILLF
jgi:hypothetical protein